MMNSLRLSFFNVAFGVYDLWQSLRERGSPHFAWVPLTLLLVLRLVAIAARFFLSVARSITPRRG
ncbi:MAG: hypothetical protein ACTMHZ_03745, partial [Bifidobacterium psychraerophilum]